MSGNILTRGVFLAIIGFITMLLVGLQAHAGPPSALPSATLGQAYSYTMVTDTDNVPPVAVEIVDGSLPPGLTLAVTGPRTAVISGTPTTAGNFMFQIRLEDSDPVDVVIDYVWVSIDVNPPPAPIATDTSITTPFNTPVDIDVAPLISGDWDRIEVSYWTNGDVVFNGSVLTYTPPRNLYGPQTVQYAAWKEPDGIRGYGDIEIDVLMPPAPVAHDFSVTAKPGESVVIDTLVHLDAAASIWYSTIVSDPSQGTVSAGGGSELIYNAARDAEGTDTFTFTVTDIHGQESNIATVTVMIEPAAPDIVIQLPLKDTLRGTVGEEFHESFPATGGTEPYDYIVIDGTLPPGLHLDGDAITGIPSEEGTTTIRLRATDQDGNTGEGTYTIVIGPVDEAAEPPSAADHAVDAVLDGDAVEINLATLTAGEWDRFEIVSQPEKGTLFDNGMFVTFTPSEIGADSFTWRAVGRGGVSNVATVSISISDGDDSTDGIPVAVDHTVYLAPAESGSQDLTAGASGSPFLQATIVNGIDPDTGAASLSGTVLRFTPTPTFSGAVRIGYRLENAAGISNTAYVTFVVAARPDPSGDPDVIGLQTAQQETARQLADDQITTITGRLERLHNEDYCERESAIDLRIGHANGDSDPDDPSRDSVNLSGKTFRSCNLAVWGAGYVSLANYDRGGVDFSSTGLGLTVGADYRFSPTFVGGVAVGYGRSKSEIGSYGTESVAEAMSAALYASWHKEGWYLDGLLGYQQLRFDNTRFVTANGGTAYGSRSGDQVFGALLGGYEFRNDGFLIAPYVGVRGSYGTLNRYSETGGGIYGLTYGDQRVSSISGVAGVRIEKEIEQSWGTVTPSARVEHRHDFAGSSTVELGYTDTETKAYQVTVPGTGRDSVTVGVGLKAQPKDSDWSIEGTLSSTFGNGKPSTYVGVRATYKF